MINIGVTIVELLIVTPQTITHMENNMNRLLSKFKDCDGRFCEEVATYGLALTVFSIMYLSIAQI